ncbi:MAG: LD-carboxypeptidase [Lachnospiraceae bacterium]|nr:LD-carboxypeptidase [Lachnospiraceae bacterium]
MRYPKFLKDGGTIGFIAPSFGCATEPYKTAFESALETFKQAGYKTILGPNVYKSDGVGISTDPVECAREVNIALTADSLDAVISCGGGELMCEILPYVDFEAIKAAPAKLFQGYSDNTNLTFLLNTICDTAAIYGPCASEFGMKPWHKAIGDSYALLRGEKLLMDGYDNWEKDALKSEENPLASYHVTEPTKYFPYNGKMPVQKMYAEGRLIGGCMDCLVNLVGTKYDRVKEFVNRYNDEGILWFLEACDLGVMDMRRALWHMREAGWFEHASGFLIGRPMRFYDEAFGQDHLSAVLGILGEFGVPVIMDLDIGHLSPQIPILSGSYAHAMATDKTFSLEMELK